MAPILREARPEDAPALVELERLSPEVGRITFRIDLQPNDWQILARFPGARGHVALDEGTSAIIGMIFASSAPTQLNGKLVPAVYIFGLRVHPGHRRRGVASALIAHACERARAETGARTAWAAIVEGNTASLRTFHRAGFLRLRDLRAKVLLPGLGWPARRPLVATRPAIAADLPALAEVLNRFCAGHNFWRPKTAAGLRAEFDALRHAAPDCQLALAEDGAVLAATCGLELSRVARLRLLGIRPFPGLATHLLAPLLGLIPLNPVLVRYCAFPTDQPATAVAVLHGLHRRYLPSSWATIVTADPLDPVWQAVDSIWGVAGRVHLVVRTEEPVDQARPSYIPQ